MVGTNRYNPLIRKLTTHLLLESSIGLLLLLNSDILFQWLVHLPLIYLFQNNPTDKSLLNPLRQQPIHIFLLRLPQRKIQFLHNSDLLFLGFLLKVDVILHLCIIILYSCNLSIVYSCKVST